jgi:sigma-E factor negative regulatory protein RseA
MPTIRTTMNESTPNPQDPRWLVSALADGEADPDECRLGLTACAEPQARACWHAYHLIGDVLRSDDLASAPAHDRAFLERLRARLGEEPLPRPELAAASAGVPPRGRDDFATARPGRRWALPLALAAGVMALGTALVVQRAGGDAATPQLASAAGASAPTAALPPVPAGTVLVRDAQLDRYLRAHREYGAAQPVSLPVASRRDLEPVVYGR